MTFDDASRIMNFLVEYAREGGLTQPVAPWGRDLHPSVLLPASKTKEGIFQLYVAACSDADHPHMKLTAFKNTWLSVCPHIQAPKPRSDVCHEYERSRKEVLLLEVSKRQWLTLCLLDGHPRAGSITTSVSKTHNKR